MESVNKKERASISGSFSSESFEAPSKLLFLSAFGFGRCVTIAEMNKKINLFPVFMMK